MAKIVRFLKAAEVNNRLYFKGSRHEFSDEVADQLVADGYADLPVSTSILSEGAKEQYVSDAVPTPEPEGEGKVMSTPRKPKKK